MEITFVGNVHPDPAGALMSTGVRDFSCTYVLQCLTGHFTPSSCLSNLTHTGFDRLRADNTKVTGAFRLHIDSIVR